MGKKLKLGVTLGYWGAGKPAHHREAVAEAERLGFGSVWAAESWGPDALTPLKGAAFLERLQSRQAYERRTADVKTTIKPGHRFPGPPR